MAEKSESFWSRHLDGWQAGVVLLLIAGSAVMLAIPRTVEPQHIPPPQTDYAALHALMAADDQRAASALNQELDPTVRLVGREVRSYNRATVPDEQAHDRGGRALATARRRLAHVVTRALPLGEEPLLALRAYQMQRFIEVAGTWRCGSQAPAALIELGGDFVAAAERNDWCRGDGRLLPSERALRVLFKRRWNEITGLHEGGFALSLDEDRVRYDFLLRHPFIPHRTASLVPRLGLERSRNKARLAAIERLARRDQSYHGQLARGVILYRQGNPALAADAFRQHLAERPDGPFTLYAQNYLKAALDAVAGTP